MDQEFHTYEEPPGTSGLPASVVRFGPFSIKPCTDDPDSEIRTLDFSTKWRIGEFSVNQETEIAHQINMELDRRGIDAANVVSICIYAFKVRIFYRYTE